MCPAHPLLDVAVCREPKGPSGDFALFAAFRGWLQVLLGDLCGKGLEAAPRADALCSVARRGGASGSASSILERLNRGYCSALEAETGDPFQIPTAAATAFSLHAATGRVTLASAGSPPPLVVSRGQVRSVRAEHGLLLGIDPSAIYRSTALLLHEGDAVVLFTDGVTDSRKSAGGRLGEDGFAGILGRHAGTRPAGALADRVMDDLRGLVTLTDDCALVVVSRRDGTGMPAASFRPPLIRIPAARRSLKAVWAPGERSFPAAGLTKGR